MSEKAHWWVTALVIVVVVAIIVIAVSGVWSKTCPCFV
jgi:hypothetical protein